MNPIQPNAKVPIVDPQTGTITRAWAEYFEKLAKASEEALLAAFWPGDQK